jgi:hypothetical protein
MKHCPRCKTAFPIDHFRRDANRTDGRWVYCNGCASANGWAGRIKVVRRRSCPNCHKSFRPKIGSGGRLVEHCSQSCRLKGSNNPNWVGDDASYLVVHERLRTGPQPSACAKCGATDRPMQWAFNHEACESPRQSEYGPYSVDPADYTRLCVPCHKRMDLDRLAAA